MKTKPDKKLIIGRLERIVLPNLTDDTLEAKIDTGAYTSSLHCHDVQLFQKKERQWVRFFLLDPAHPVYKKEPFECPVFKLKKIRSSNGLVSERVIIKQKAFFCDETRTIQLSLSDRSDMKYPVLIGRRFISGNYLVDVSKKYINE